MVSKGIRRSKLLQSDGRVAADDKETGRSLSR